MKAMLLFCDNYYTHPNLASMVRRITDGEVVMIGTMRINYLDENNREKVEKELSTLNKRIGELGY